MDNKKIFIEAISSSVIHNKISDHMPLTANNIISWNVMMQGRKTQRGYNNAFRLTESKVEYRRRLQLIVLHIAMIHFIYPTAIIALQEAPIDPDDVTFFSNEMSRFINLRAFLPTMDSLHAVSTWGIMTLVNCAHYSYIRHHSVWCGDLSTYNERAQEIQIICKKSHARFFYTNIHMPYQLAHNPQSGSHYVTNILNLFHASAAQAGITLPFIIAGDLNTHPKHIANTRYSCLYKENNNVHINESDSLVEETVDAIIHFKFQQK